MIDCVSMDMNTDLSMDALIAEYKAMLAEVDAGGGISVPVEKIAVGLAEQLDWSDAGADALVRLYRQYGDFMLRNALALAVALEIEDGALGF